MKNMMEMKELNLNQMERISGGVDRESVPGDDGKSLITIIIDFIFGD